MSFYKLFDISSGKYIESVPTIQNKIDDWNKNYILKQLHFKVINYIGEIN